MKPKILIVDDEVDILDIYSMKFEKEGFEVYKENNGKNAIRAIKEKKPNIVLLDIMMEGRDGYGIIKNLKEDEEVKNIPVILFSNLGQKENIEEGIMHGAVDYIPKANFTPEKVAERVKKILNENSND